MKMDVNQSVGITMFEMLTLSRVPALIFAIVLALVPISAGQDKPTKKKDKEATTTVISEGTGKTKQDALKDAIRNAVRQAVGAIVDTETLVKNDKIIEDRIILFSDGIVKTYEELDPPTRDSDDGLTHVKIKALVERQKLLTRISDTNVQKGKIDGKGIFSEAVSRLDKDKESVELLEKHFEGFPEKYLKASIVGDPKVVEKTNETVTLEFKVVLEPDYKTLDPFIAETIKLMDAIEGKNNKFLLRFHQSGSRFSLQDQDIVGKLRDVLKEIDALLDSEKSGKPILLATSKDLTGGVARFTTAPIRLALSPLFTEVGKRTCIAEISIEDANAEVLAQARIEKFFQDGLDETAYYTNLLSNKGFISTSLRQEFYCIAPFFIVDEYPRICLKVHATPRIKVSLNDAANASEFSIEVRRKNP